MIDWRRIMKWILKAHLRQLPGSTIGVLVQRASVRGL
jgi:hypothetical protein